MTSSNSLPTKPTDPAPPAGDGNTAQPHFMIEGYSSIPKEDLDFVSEQTGIKDEGALRQHIFGVQAEALGVHPYKYIKMFAFVNAALHLSSRDSAPTPPTLNSLNPLRAYASAIHISAVFHLFSEEQQLRLAGLIAGLLPPEPGSIIFGMQSGRAEKGLRVETSLATSHGKQMFCYSPESWREMWEDVFPKGAIRVDASLTEVKRPDLKPVGEDAKFWLLTWCVTRL
uniref:FAD-binding monooxygenase BOA2 ) n=1 Tax=Ganoderma boninense TaxID=34458 RepID=A0A5K1K7X2_9APHY|nr:FAD-binding monooxygenase BOA2 (EC (Botcinic acid biosynthesis cluster A protein 2) [Ganoderma boninense]